MIPLIEPNLSGNEARYLQECIDVGFVSSVGAFVDRFEEMVAQASGNTYAVATASGTSGLHLALVALGVKQNDLVILPSLTFIASANAISQCAATPWLLDVDQGSWTLDPNLLEQVLARDTEQRGEFRYHKATGKRVAAVMPVYTLGLPADMDRICEIARSYKLPVVADAAAALGASYKGRAVGQLGADLSVYSFNGNKTVTSGSGGAVSGDDPDLLALCKHLSTTARCGPGYSHDYAGFNYRMSNLEAAVGCAQLEQLDRFVNVKKQIAQRYNDALGDIDGLECFPVPPWAESSCWLSGVVVKPGNPSFDVAKLQALLQKHDVDARPFWKPMHLQKPYADAPRTQMAVCEDVWQRVITLPCSTHLSKDDQDMVIGLIQEASK